MAFDVPADWVRIRTIDAHTAGEPLRIITEGFPELPGDTILAKRRAAREQHDVLRRILMLEPRGHADMYGCILTPPVTPDGDVGVLFLHNEGYSTMCGHGIIALVTVGIECGLLPVEGQAPRVRIDTPAGRVTATARLRAGRGSVRPGGSGGSGGPRVEGVSFLNVPSFVLARDERLEVPGLGSVRYDLAYGGAFYAYVDARDVGLSLEPREFRRIIDLGTRIKRAVVESRPIVHPGGDPDLGFLYGVIFVGPSAGPRSRNVCVFAEGEVDRSPTGTGVSGRAALHHARGELGLEDTLTIESLIGTTFEVRVAETLSLGGLPAVVPEVSGRAHLTGRHEFLLDPEDPLAEGFLLR